MRKCILVKTNLEISVVELPEDDTFNDEVYKLLDCTCWEGVTLGSGLYMLFDENGKLTEPAKELNRLATMIYPGGSIDPIVGDVLLSKIGKNVNGESDLVSLSDVELTSLQVALKSVKDLFLKMEAKK